IVEVGRAPLDRLTVFENLFRTSRLYVTSRVYRYDCVPSRNRALEMISYTSLVSLVKQLPEVLPQLLIDLGRRFHARLAQLTARGKFHPVGGKTIHHESRTHALSAIVIRKYGSKYSVHATAHAYAVPGSATVDLAKVAGPQPLWHD